MKFPSSSKYHRAGSRIQSIESAVDISKSSFCPMNPMVTFISRFMSMCTLSAFSTAVLALTTASRALFCVLLRSIGTSQKIAAAASPSAAATPAMMPMIRPFLDFFFGTAGSVTGTVTGAAGV